MDFLNRARSFIEERLYAVETAKQDERSRMDAYLNFIYKIITWEDPKLSWMTFIFLNFVYILIIYYEVKFYCILFMSALSWILLDFYGEIIDLKQQAKCISHKQICNGMRTIVVYFKSLKRDNPSWFGFAMIGLFFSLSFIGRTIPGQVLFYIVILAAFFGPYLVALIPEERKEQIRDFVEKLQATEGVVAETELIPFISANFNEDRDNDLDSLLTDRTQDSVTNSLISGLSTMPSHLEADNNVDELEEDDLLPHTSKRHLAYSAVDYSSDSDSEHRNIEFDSAHFNRDSSSDDDNHFTSDLQFSDVVDKALQAATGQSLGAGILGNITNMGTSLLSNVIQTAANLASNTNTPANRRDSDSDFEIINSEDAEGT